MSLSALLAEARPVIAQHFELSRPVLPAIHPACVLFFSLCDAETRSSVSIATGSDFSAVWKTGVIQCQRLAKRRSLDVHWLRIDWVVAVEPSQWANLRTVLEKTKRYYFRFGLALGANFEHAFLEQELNANAMLYRGGTSPAAHLNPANFKKYAKERFGAKFLFSSADDQPVWLFATEGIFISGDTALRDLPGGTALQHLSAPDVRRSSWRNPATLNCGRRVVGSLDMDATYSLIRSGSEFLGRQVLKSGKFVYGHFPCFGREITAYNTLRHASSVYSMLEAWELTRSDALMASINRAITHLSKTIVKHYPQHDGSTLAFNVDISDEIKLGANAVSLLALVKYDELTGNQKYRPLMEALALGIAHMQDASTGKFVHVLNARDLSVKNAFRIIYYDGEAVFGLMRLYGLTRNPRWLAVVEHAFDHFLEADHWKHHDHWLSYCANELTFYKPEEKYFRFGVQNIAGYLDFILQRETTYPTLLELSMAFEAMLRRIDNEHPHMRHVLEGIDIEKFYRALHHRARYLLNGFFWPELAMYFAKPKSITGSFFIRHHSFRVRIDDVEHYLSGLVAYRKMLGRQGAPRVTEKADDLPSQPKPAGPVVTWGGDVNLGRRQHYRTAELGPENILRIPALQAPGLRIVNLECVIATQGEQGVRKGEDGPYYYRARPEMLRVLAGAGIDMVAIANNHSGDYGPQALMEQGRCLDALGIAYAGGGAHREAAFSPVIRRAGNLNVALFSVDATQPRFAATTEAAGSAHLPLADASAWQSELTPRIAAARQQAHVVLVALHWGDNLAAYPSPAEIAIGHAVIEAGADALLGASAHVLQGIEIYRGRPILYDAGDLLFDSVRRTLGKGGVFQLEISEHGVERVIFVPVGIGFGFSEQLTGQTAIEAAQDFARQCDALGCQMQVTREGRAYIDLSPARRQTRTLAPAPLTQYDPGIFDRLPPPDPGAWQVADVPVDARLEKPLQLGPLTLLGVRVKPTEITRRRMLWVESFWRCEGPIEDDIRLDIRGVPVKQTKMRPWGEGMDHDPCDWMVPTSRWQPEVIYRDYYGLRPPYLKDWENVDLRLTVGIVSQQYANVVPIPLRYVIHLAVPGKDESIAPQIVPTYRTEFPGIIHDCKPGQTWTADQLEAVTGGKWLVRPPEGWFVRSVVAAKKHIALLPEPVLYVAHAYDDRARHEQYSRQTRQFWDRHETLAEITPALAGALVTRNVAAVPCSFPMLQVDDPIRALIELGVAARQRYRGDVFAITGTAGKSTTLAILQTVLGGPERVFASIDNYNTRVGAPAMLANLLPDHEAAVIEIAQSGLWMKRGPVTRLVKPTVALITEIGVSQTDARVKSVEDTARWKSRIFDGLTGAAIAIVGEHLPCFDYVIAQARKHAKRIVVFGRSDAAEVRILDVKPDGEGSWVSLRLPTGPLRCRVPLPGPGMVNNAVAALSAVYASGRDPAEAAQRLQGFHASEGRMQKQTLHFHGKAIQLIDDSFNATVTSMLNAFGVFGTTPVEVGGRKIAVLGRIVHLGDLAKPLHESLAEPLLAIGVAKVITHGNEMHYLRAVLPEEILGPHFSNATSLVEYLYSMLRANDLLLVKGSRRDSDFGLVCDLLRKLVKVDHSDNSTPSAKLAASPAAIKPKAECASSQNSGILSAITASEANDFLSSPYHGRKGDIARHLIEDAAKSLAFTVRTEKGRTFRVDGEGMCTIFSQNSPDTSVVAGAITRNKHLTKVVLRRHGIPVPAGQVFRDRSDAFAYFRTRHTSQVIKPLDGEAGYGVTAGVSDEVGFSDAWDRATRTGRRVIVEDFVAGDEVRIITIGSEVGAAVCRVPAYVVGDGQHSIGELVAFKNQSRKTNPLLKIYPLKHFDLLEASGRSLEEMPARGERVQLASVSNIGMGGESVSLMGHLHPSILTMAKQVAQAIPGATLLGLDVSVQDFGAPAMNGNAIVLEVNSNPAIATPFFAAYGEPASNLPRQMLVQMRKQVHTTGLRHVEKSEPRLVPAGIYTTYCSGASFPRSYSTQMRLLRQAAHARNIKVEAVSDELTLLAVNKEHVAFFQGMCSRTRAVARRATNNKEWTKELLSRAGIPTPFGASFVPDQMEDAWHFLASTGQLGVVKPIVGSGGNGISTDIATREHFEQAWGIASATGAKTILIEEYVDGNDYRVLVVGNDIRAVTQRIPAHLIGDGMHTVAELLKLKNAVRRSNPYNGSKLAILTPMIRRNLARLGIDEATVIEKGRYLQLHTVANIGSGGDSRDVTDRVHPDWAPVAAKVRESVYDPVHIGFDLIAEDVAKPPFAQRWRVIEVNCNPDFGMQHFPSEGIPRDVAGALMEYLFPDCVSEKPEARSLHILITGKVQGLRYRNWLWREAHLHTVHGWVRNLPDGRVEAVFRGSPNAVTQLVEACHVGPKGAQVKSIASQTYGGEVPLGFRVVTEEGDK